MGNLIRMDLYRMNKAKSFRVCLILAFVFALFSTPLDRLMYTIGDLLNVEDVGSFPETENLCTMIASSLSSITALLALLSVVSFFHADMESGYIKNIAGQMPRRGYSILSRFIAAIALNLVFMLAALAGNLIGTMALQRIVVDGSVLESVGLFLLRLLLLQSICSVLLLVTASFRNKSLGMILAVVLGLPLLSLIYMAINAGLDQLFKGFSITPYMPDQVMREAKPDLIRALLVAGVTIGIFLPLSIRIFDKKDVK